jgi:hypothetical protein
LEGRPQDQSQLLLPCQLVVRGSTGPKPQRVRAEAKARP